MLPIDSLYWESLSIRLPDRPLILGIVIDKGIIDNATDRPLILGIVIDKGISRIL